MAKWAMVWKGFAARKRVRKEREEEMMFIHMVPAPAPPYKNTAKYASLKNEDKRRTTQETNEQEYQNARISVKQKIREVEGPDMKETLQESIREWFIETRDATGKFPDFPEPE
ncbi:uncharacterized protein LOC134845018 [Symsagittifera roscoffensis]|uniref:uncharacterized protein LOC134845018 n=1 Tax=Symsagittifera roscoffensis TaxID=84072 RepID=UPI00307BE4BD